METTEQVLMRLLGEVRSSRRSTSRKLGAATLPKAAQELRLTVSALERLTRDGTIQTSRVNGELRVPFSEIVRFVQARHIQHARRNQTTSKPH